MSKSYRFGYHYTRTLPENIIRDGFHQSTSGYTLHVEDEIAALNHKYLPVNRCFVSNPDMTPQFNTFKNLLVIDISGLNLFPDFSNLIELGGYYDEDLDADDGSIYFWWKDRDITGLSNRGFSAFSDYLTSTGGYVYPDEFTGEMSWNLIGTACVNGDSVTPDRIVRV